MKRVSEVSALLGISKQAIHKKIKHPQFQKFIVKDGSIIYLKDEAISILKEQILNRNSTVNHQPEVDKHIDGNIDTNAENLYKMLISEKDERINQLTKQVDDLTRLLEQQQILTLNAQSETKLIQANVSAPSVENEEDPTWFKKWFTKKNN